MNIFFAVNNAYAEQLCVSIVSLLENNRSKHIDFYILSADFSESSRLAIELLKRKYRNFDAHYPAIDNKLFDSLSIKIDYITKETYFRYLIADIAPHLDKALYLDADLIVNGNLDGLWDTDLGDKYVAGANDLYIHRLGYKAKIGFNQDDLYVNAGVLLFNLAKMRADNITQKFFENSKKLATKIEFQDQDIINITFKGKIKEIDSIYNFCTANTYNEPSKIKKAVIVHYSGAIKPWKWNYKNKLKNLWLKYAKINDAIQSRKIKVALIIDEFFGAVGTAFGGYGFLARKYIAKYIPNKNISIDVLLGRSSSHRYTREKLCADDINIYKLPKRKFFASRWLKHKNYDVYLSIELTYNYVLEREMDKSKKLILWIQDPRPKSDWDEINTVKLFPETSYYDQRIYDTVHKWTDEKRVKFISQAYFLNPKAIELYKLDKNTDIEYLPNPVDIDKYFDVAKHKKKDMIIFLGRLESIKRGWLFCEIAKKMPQYEFYVLGQTFREKEQNSKVLSPYQNIQNLHFAGHVDGDDKAQFLKDAKILVNTSIHEALPVSFLEAFAYGTLIVSNQNPENLTAAFGIWVGKVLGDGFDKVDLYVQAIEQLIKDDKNRRELSKKAREYIEKNHNVDDFTKHLRKVILDEICF